jgi:Tfp pilus assembly protein FimT
MASMSKNMNHRKSTTSGFNILELLVVMVITLVMAVMAFPAANSAIATYKLDAAADSASGALQGTSYQAIMHGYPYQVNFNTTTNTFQVLNEVPPASTFSNVGSAVPISGSKVVMAVGTGGTGYTGQLVMQFSPNGSVSIVSGQTMPATFTIAYNGTTKHFTVSNYGSVSISSTTP